MAPFVLAALPSLINAAPSLIRLFGGGGEQTEKNAKAAEIAVEIAAETAFRAVREIAPRWHRDCGLYARAPRCPPLFF